MIRQLPSRLEFISIRNDFGQYILELFRLLHPMRYTVPGRLIAIPGYTRAGPMQAS